MKDIERIAKEKIKAGMKIIEYKIDKQCFESFPCQHYVRITLEDGSNASLMMTNGRNMLGDITLH